jgi:hypothetical protein
MVEDAIPLNGGRRLESIKLRLQDEASLLEMENSQIAFRIQALESSQI